jgi:hypothetical protein
MTVQDETVENIITVLKRVYEVEGEGTHLSFLDIQKILYHLRQRLDDDNALAQSLPYYWYFDGPVSDVVKQTVDKACTEDILEADRSQGTNNERYKLVTDGGVATQSSSTLEIGDTSDIEVSDDLSTALSVVETVLDEDYNIRNSYVDKVEPVYQDAPYEFQRYCKFEILEEVQMFVHNRPWAIQPSALYSVISKGEMWLPLDSEFTEFNDLYSTYVSLSRRYLESVDSKQKSGNIRFGDLTESMWETFCYQLRLIVHDDYYDNPDNLESWKDDFQQKRDQFADQLNRFKLFINNKMKTGKDEEPTPINEIPSQISEDSPVGAATVAYLSDSKHAQTDG